MSKYRLLNMSYWIAVYVAAYLILSIIFMDFDIDNWEFAKRNLVKNVEGRFMLTGISMLVFSYGALFKPSKIVEYKDE